jgi:hypothetical protein
MSGSIPPISVDSPNPARHRFLQIAGTGLVAAPVARSLNADTKRIMVQGSEASLTLDPTTDYYEHKLTVTKGKIEEDQPPKTPGEEGLQNVRLMRAI